MLKIAVIGCGAVGLTTALEIQTRFENRVCVTIFADKFSPNTTSDIAAGFWEPYLLAENVEADVIKWSKATFEYLLKLWKKGEAKEAGICLQPAVTLLKCKYYCLPKWVTLTLGYNELSDSHLQSLSKLYNQSFTGGFMFVGFTWEAVIFLPYFQRQFLKRNGSIIERRIEKFNELEEFDVIVNCTGLEARNLSNDQDIVPIRGQVLRVEAPWQYVIYLIQSDKDEDCCYIIPNTNTVVLGGTKQESYDTSINIDDTQKILGKTKKLCPSMEKARVIKEFVGLRPLRYKVRLEEEYVKTDDGKILKIVHNYGHGGAGITLSVGCAKDAVKIIERVLGVVHAKLKDLIK